MASKFGRVADTVTGRILLVNDLIIVLGEDGKLRLVEANHQKHVELGKIDALADKTWNTFAISGEHLVVRNNQEMACYQLVIEKSLRESQRVN